MAWRRTLRTALLAVVTLSVAALAVEVVRDRVVTRSDVGGAAAPMSVGATAADPQPTDQVVAYYFHRTTRCNTCRAIERQAHATLTSRFGPQLDSGALSWRAINVDEPRFEHFVEEYDLTSSALVLVELRDGRAARWVALEDVWTLVGDPERFATYVDTRVHAFLRGER